MNSPHDTQQAYTLGVGLALQQIKTAGIGDWVDDLPFRRQKRQEALNQANLASLGIPMGLLGVAALGGVAERKLSPKMEGGALENTLRQAMELPKKVSVKYNIPSIMSHFDPEKSVIRTSPKTVPSVLAHEMGHASGSGIHMLPYGLGKILGTSLVPAAALAQATNPDSPWTTAATYAPAAFMSPVLYEEARASARALKGLSHLGGKGAVLRGLTPLLGAFGSYGSVAAMPFITRKLINNVYGRD